LRRLLRRGAGEKGAFWEASRFIQHTRHTPFFLYPRSRWMHYRSSRGSPHRGFTKRFLAPRCGTRRSYTAVLMRRRCGIARNVGAGRRGKQPWARGRREGPAPPGRGLGIMAIYGFQGLGHWQTSKAPKSYPARGVRPLGNNGTRSVPDTLETSRGLRRLAMACRRSAADGPAGPHRLVGPPCSAVRNAGRGGQAAAQK
jgi:hypothetical protein